MMMMQRSLPVYTVGGSGPDVYQLLAESVDQLRHRLGSECTVCVCVRVCVNMMIM